MIKELRDTYDFCKAMMEIAKMFGDKQAEQSWSERAEDAYLNYGYEAGAFGE